MLSFLLFWLFVALLFILSIYFIWLGNTKHILKPYVIGQILFWIDVVLLAILLIWTLVIF